MKTLINNLPTCGTLTGRAGNCESALIGIIFYYSGIAVWADGRRQGINFIALNRIILRYPLDTSEYFAAMTAFPLKSYRPFAFGAFGGSNVFDYS